MAIVLRIRGGLTVAAPERPDHLEELVAAQEAHGVAARLLHHSLQPGHGLADR